MFRNVTAAAWSSWIARVTIIFAIIREVLLQCDRNPKSRSSQSQHNYRTKLNCHCNKRFYNTEMRCTQIVRCASRARIHLLPEGLLEFCFRVTMTGLCHEQRSQPPLLRITHTTSAHHSVSGNLAWVRIVLWSTILNEESEKKDDKR